MSAVLSIPRYPADVTPSGCRRRSAARHTGRGRRADVVAIGTGQTGATYRVTATYATDPGDLPQPL